VALFTAWLFVNVLGVRAEPRTAAESSTKPHSAA
jgi:hypothetical protein